MPRQDHFQDISVEGNISVSANTTVEGNLTPDTDDSRSLGSALKRWANLFLSGVLNATGFRTDTITLDISNADVVLSRDSANVLGLAAGDAMALDEVRLDRTNKDVVINRVAANVAGLATGDSLALDQIEIDRANRDIVLSRASANKLKLATGDSLQLDEISAVSKVNNIIFVDGVVYATTGAGIQAALDALPAGGGTVILSPGTYAATAQLTVSNKPVRILGAGRGITTITWATATGGISYSTTTDSHQLEIADMTLLTTTAGGGTAITADWPDISSSTTTHAYIHNVEINYTTANVDYWNKGIDIRDGWNSVIKDVWITGKPPAGQTFLAGSAGIHLQTKSIDVNITDAHIYHFETGILADGANIEGLQVGNPVIVSANYGIKLSTSVALGGHGIFGGHVSAFTQCIVVDNRYDFTVKGMLLYKHTSSTQDWTAISVQNPSNYLRIEGNSIFGVGLTGAEDGINIQNSDSAVITGNLFNTVATGVILNAGATNCHVRNNVGVSVTAIATDSGTNNYVELANPGATTYLFDRLVKGPRFESTIATGTAPLTVASTTKVTNLNADLLDGANTATAGTASTVALRDASGRLTSKRYIADGTALVAGDFALDANWGTGASIGTITGTDQAFSAIVTSGTTAGASPTIILTFKDGTWTNAPIAVCSWGSGGTGTIADLLISTSATTLTITYNGTPNDSSTFPIYCVLMGR